MDENDDFGEEERRQEGDFMSLRLSPSSTGLQSPGFPPFFSDFPSLTSSYFQVVGIPLAIGSEVVTSHRRFSMFEPRLQ